MRLSPVTSLGASAGHVRRLLVRSFDGSTTCNLTENDIIQHLSNECKDLRLKIKSKELTKAGYLSRKYVAEGRPVGMVQVFNDKKGGRKIAYVGNDNWGAGVLLPRDSGIGIFSDRANACPLLVMSLRDLKNNPYIFLAHIYCENIDDQVNNIVSNLKERNMIPEEIVFAPMTLSQFSTAADVLDEFLGKELTFIERKDSSSGFANRYGWAITEEGSNEIYWSKLWGSIDNVPSINNSINDFMDKGSSMPFTGFPFKFFSGDSLQLSSDFNIALVKGNDGRVEIYDIKKNEQIYTSKNIKCAALSPSGSKLITVSSRGEAKLWDILPEIKARECNFSPPYSVSQVAFSPCESKIVFVACNFADVGLLHISNEEKLVSFNVYNGLCVAISPNGTKVAIGYKDGKVDLFDSKTGDKLRSFKPHDDYSGSIMFSNDGSKMLTAGYQLAKIWDTETWKELGYVFYKPSIRSAFFNTDGRSILIVNGSSEISLHYPIDL